MARRLSTGTTQFIAALDAAPVPSAYPEVKAAAAKLRAALVVAGKRYAAVAACGTRDLKCQKGATAAINNVTEPVVKAFQALPRG